MTRDITPLERRIISTLRASATPLTLPQIQKSTGLHAAPVIETSLRFLAKAGALLEMKPPKGEPLYTAERK